jgi:hypothetical protein
MQSPTSRSTHLWVSGVSGIGGAAIVGGGDVETADVGVAIVVAIVLPIEVSVATGPHAASDAIVHAHNRTR